MSLLFNPRVYFLTFVSILLPILSVASSLQVEGASTTSVYNYFQLPNNDGNRVNLQDRTGLSYRLTGKIDITDSGSLYFIYAPLTLNYQQTSTGAFTFNGQNFVGGQTTDVEYKFNSYRLGYLWSLCGETFQCWLGPVLKVRDAKIRVSQNGVSESFDNVGLVPLIGAGFSYQWYEILSLYFHLDGLAASQGSAYDGVMESRLHLSRQLAVSLGFRLLGGGADNDTLKNFAQFNSATLGLIYHFSND